MNTWLVGKSCFICCLLVVGAACPVFAEEQAVRLEDLVVTATRSATAVDEVGSSVTVVTAEEMEQRQQRTVLEVLRAVPALDVVQSGGPGGSTAVFLRGAPSQYTLVMVDGVVMNDPSNTSRSFDFFDLSTDGVERVEILRGPQSTLYGSDAMAGVINIITRRGAGRPQGYLSLEGGSFTTLRERLGFSGGTDLLHYNVAVSRQDTSGISTAARTDGNREADGFHTTSVATRLGVTPNKQFEVESIVRFSDSRTELDNGGGAGQDDPNNVARSQQLFLRSEARLSLFDDLWQQKLGISFTNLERTYRNDTDVNHPVDLSRSTYHGRTLVFDWQHTLALHKAMTLTLGVETREERAESDYYEESMWGPSGSTFPARSARTSGFYFQDRISLWDAWFTTLGVRVDHHSRFGTEATWRATTSYLVKQTATRLRGSYGTGFKAPSLYQLYEPTYGDQGLSPEKSRGWDVGLEQALFDGHLELSASWFANDFKDMIDFDSSAYRYGNIARAESSGAELTATVRPTDDLTLRAGYTYTRTEDKSDGEELLRRPKHKVSGDVSYRFNGQGTVTVAMIYVGSRDDRFFDPVTYTSERVKLGGYLLVNLAAAYQLNPWLQLHGRIDNLLDRDYEAVKGYGTPGIAAYGGVKISF
jgi:vitamin B12 transporter